MKLLYNFFKKFKKIKISGILGCPWCGEQPIINFKSYPPFREWSNDYSILCDEIDCFSPIKFFKTKQEAIDAWNKRKGINEHE